MKRLLLLSSAVLLWAACAWGQSQGAIEIKVADSTGAVIPGAQVQLFSSKLEAPALASGVSDSRGVIRFERLAPGNYRVHVSIEGFLTSETAVTVAADKTEELIVRLQLGSVTETVEISQGRRRGMGIGRIFGPSRRKSAPMRPPGSGGGVGSGSGGGIGGGAFRVPANTEEYDHIAESGFHSPSDNPLSTFSIDVDTASYSNFRRFLRQGRLPPADAVRIEELLNYFRYNDPVPEAGAAHPVRVTAELAACPWKPGHKLARVALRSRSIDMADLAPSNLTFLIDVSGSMGYADKLPLLKKALAMLAEQLRPQDRVAIVVYAGAAGVVLDSTSGSQPGKILEALERLHAGGSTAGAKGIELAYKTARANFIKGGNNRVILATDGDFNVGVSSQGELVRLIEKQREHGVFLTVLGFGQGNLADARMEQIADHGNGQFMYIDSPLEARRALVEQIGGTLATVAKDVKIQVEFNPTRVAQYRLIGYENRMLAAKDFDDDAKDAGEMGAGHSVVALYEIIPPSADEAATIKLRYQEPSPTKEAKRSGELLTVKVRYKPPTADESQLLSQPLLDASRSIEEAGEELRWSAAVAQYGMLLRDSNHHGEATWDSTAALARGALGEDRSGLRAELASLIRTAQALHAEPRP